MPDDPNTDLTRGEYCQSSDDGFRIGKWRLQVQSVNFSEKLKIKSGVFVPELTLKFTIQPDKTNIYWYRLYYIRIGFSIVFKNKVENKLSIYFVVLFFVLEFSL